MAQLKSSKVFGDLDVTGEVNVSTKITVKGEEVWDTGNLLNIGTTAATARSALELGTAATRNVGISSGNLMEVEAFGVGGLSATYDYSNNDENSLGGGFFKDGNHSTIISRRSPQTGVEFSGDYNGDNFYARRFRVNDGGWQPRVELYHTGNILTSTGSSASYPMSQKAVTDALNTKANTTTQVIAGTGLTGGGTLADNRTLNVSYGTAAGTAAQGNDSRLSNSREWTAGTVSQAEAEAGTATTRRAWTAQRVWQAIVKWSSGRQIISGTGLSGGGTLAANRTLSVNYGTAAGTAAQGNDSRIVNATPNSRTITAGTGLSGGGNLTANRTISISSGVVPSTATSLGTSDLNSMQTAGYYFQSANATATTARNYPVGMAGTLVVTTAAGVVQEYTTYGPDNRKYIRGFYSTAWSAWREIGAIPSWAAVTGKPATATRWPAFTEVTGRPTNYPTTWASVAAKPAQATRWPTWAEVTSKPVTGVATQAEADAGVSDTTIVTPKKLRFGFSVSLEENGWLAFPSWLGGVAILWGKAAADTPDSYFKFRRPFPTACFSLVVTKQSDNAFVHVTVDNITKTSFNLYGWDAEGGARSANTCRWIAIGH